MKLFVACLFLLMGFSARANDAKNDSDADEKARAQKTLWTAKIERDESRRIEDLQITTPQIPVFLVPRNNELRPVVEIRVLYPRDLSGWKITQPGDYPLKKGKTPGEFSTYLYLTSKVSELTLTAIGPQGEKQTESILILAPEAQELQIVSPLKSFYAHVGLAALSFEQTGFGVFNSRSGLFELGYSTLESESRWAVLGAAKMTVATFHAEPVRANPQLIDGRLNLSYRLGVGESGRWRFRLFGGVSYLTLLSNGSPFGFSNLVSPDFSLRATHIQSSQSSYSIEFRVVPLRNANPSDQRGLHLSATWTRILKSLRRQDVKVEYSQTKFNSLQQNLAVDLLSLSLGYSI